MLQWFFGEQVEVSYNSRFSTPRGLKNMIDLHCHSTCSDGLLSPQALFEKALQQQISLLALTDHDTVAGIDTLLEAQKGHALRIIPGIELSTSWKLHDIHILGLGINHKHASLLELIAKQEAQRLDRAKQMALKLQALGIDDAFDKACRLAGHQRLSRPHFAQILVEEGKATDRAMAFKRYLQRGKPAYVPTAWISVDDAVTGIHAAEGQAVLAHPLKYKLTRTKLAELLRAFKSAGGDGIEVVSGDIATSEIQDLARLAKQFEFLCSTGSDYHGDGVSRIALGRQKPLPNDCLPIWQQWVS